MAPHLLTARALEWIAWAVNVHLNLSPALRPADVRAIVEPELGSELLPVLRRWPPDLHPLIVRSVLRESHAGAWTCVSSTDPSPPPIVRR